MNKKRVFLKHIVTTLPDKQASMSRATVRFPIKTVKQTCLLLSDKKPPYHN